MYKVSVLIPAYNSGLHIGQCLRSAFSQTLDSIEYIIIDDASTDDTIEKIQEAVSAFPQRAADVRIIRHEANMGPCASRKTGIRTASGQYVIHLDSDDWVEPECYASMYSRAEETGADVVCCGYVEERSEGTMAGIFSSDVPQDKEMRIRDVISLKLSPFVWNKLVRRTIFDDRRFVFPSYDMAEDWAICVQYALIGGRWESISEPFYHYRISNASISHDSVTKVKAVRIMEMERKNIEDVVMQLEACALSVRYSKEIEARKSNAKRFMLPYLADREIRAIWLDTFPEINLTMLVNTLIPLEYRIKHLFALLGLYTPLYAAFKKITRRP